MRAFLTLVLTVTLACYGICSILFEPYPGAYLPEYFSGTNARAHFRAYVTGGTLHIQRAQLLLNNEMVIDEPYSIGGLPGHPLYVSDTTLMTMFDSSHWASGTSVEVKMRVLADDVWSESTYLADCKNKILEYNYPFEDGGAEIDGSFGAYVVHSLFAGENYSRSLVGPSSWTPEAFFNDMTNATSVYVASHGNVGFHQSGFGPYIYWDDIESNEWGSIPGYDSQRVDHMGIGYPPLNATGNPPLNFVFLSTCLSASEDSLFWGASYPHYNAYGYFLENQALAGFTVCVLTHQTEDVASLFYGLILIGECARDAIDDFIILSQYYDILASQTGGFGTYRHMINSDIALYGDEYTKMKSMYCGEEENITNWFRRIYQI